jgi:hypothetical protein
VTKEGVLAKDNIIIDHDNLKMMPVPIGIEVLIFNELDPE